MHPIREDSHSRYMPTCGWTDRDPVMGTTHDLLEDMELNLLVGVRCWTSSSYPYYYLTSVQFAPRLHVVYTAIYVEIFGRSYARNWNINSYPRPSVCFLAVFCEYSHCGTSSWTPHANCSFSRSSTNFT